MDHATGLQEFTFLPVSATTIMLVMWKRGGGAGVQAATQ